MRAGSRAAASTSARINGTAALLALLALLAPLAGCSAGSGSALAPSAAGPTSSSAAPTGSTVSTSPPPAPGSPTPQPGSSTRTVAPSSRATAPPSWLGQRVLPIGPDGSVAARPTPPELLDRRIITVDLLPPPADGRFHARIETVPPSVVLRSSWSTGCPVSLADLRYVQLSFRGFDGLAHTGELLLNRDVAAGVVTAFGRLFAAGYPIEEMRITSGADLAARPTGDGNDTSAFACRAVRGQRTWSQHAYGRAIDVNPFDNPYVAGKIVLPELASAYTDRGRGLPGMITPGSLPVRAFTAIGWKWGGNFSSLKDWMHFSANGG